MKKILKGYKFRIYPTDEQKAYFAKAFGCTRFLWNHFLDERNKFYLENKESDKKGLNYYDNAGSLTKLKKKEEFGWLNEVGSQSLQQSLRKLEVAYSRFFRKQASFPRFKSKNGKQSFVIPQGFELTDGFLSIPKLKSKIRVVRHREFKKNSDILFVTISKTKAGSYYAAFQVEEDCAELEKLEAKVGIDVGLKDFATLSTGEKVEGYDSRKQRSKLEHNHRMLSKKKKCGSNREKARLALTRIYEKEGRRKTDFIHKFTSKAVNENQVIAVEDLSVKNMMKNHNLARSIGEASWSEVSRQLQYKAEWYGRSFVKIDRFYPSSKTCNCCGFVKQDLTLKDRSWTCVRCGSELDRDINAAKNILVQGLNILNSDEGLPAEYKQKLGEARHGTV